jgi:hypothetical protein
MSRENGLIVPCGERSPTEMLQESVEVWRGTMADRQRTAPFA